MILFAVSLKLVANGIIGMHKRVARISVSLVSAIYLNVISRNGKVR